jgi:tetratricopeptide (TPR) repeat protein
VLERAALGKPLEVALAYDWARTDALIALDRAAEALPFLIEHERAAPSNYNPPQQQARCFKALGRWEEGLAAIERALSIAYGPRKAGFLTLKADLLLGAGRADEARRVVEQQLAAYRALPAGQRQPAAEERVSQRLASWKADSVR